MATMFPCPNCGGQLRFSAGTQKLKCQSCGEAVDVDEYTPDDKIKTDIVNTNIYECPGCGGQIQLIDNDGMEFCPFCGSQATMQEKFSSQGTPKYIIPFKLTKAKAKNEYKKATKGIHFAPEGLQKDENIDKIVGLYTPYYIYDYSVDDMVSFRGSTTSASRDYYTTTYANFDMSVRADSIKVPFDASQTLDDTMAAQIEPFPMNELIDFNPNYLAGYFVENSTVDEDLYLEDSTEKAAGYMSQKVESSTGGYTIIDGGMKSVERELTDSLRYGGTEGAYLPLYFATTRYKDRVAYSIVNGATGKTYIDMPIDKRSMFKMAAIVSLIIFAALVAASFIFSFSFKVKTLCGFAALIASIIALIGAVLADKTYRSDNHLDDKGFFASRDRIISTGKKEKKLQKRTKAKKSDSSLTVMIALVMFVMFGGIQILQYFSAMINAICYLASIILVIMALVKVKKGKKNVMLFGIVGWLLAIAVRICDMPNDIYYYGALFVVFVVILLAIHGVVDEYNRFATHPSPQYMKKGGGLERERD